MNSKRVLNSILVGCVVMYCALPSSAHAGTLSYLGTMAEVGFFLPPNPLNNLNCFGGGNGVATASCNSSSLYGPGPLQTPDYNTTDAVLNYDTSSAAAYGILHSAASSSITGANGTSDGYDSAVEGNAYFYDIWTITGGPGTLGTQGTLNLTFAVDGTYNDCNSANPGMYFGVNLSLDNYNNNEYPQWAAPSPFASCSGSISQNVTLSTHFTFGTPLDFLAMLSTGSTLSNLGVDQSSSVDFSNTAQMNAIVVQNANGNTIPFGLNTASGAALFSQLAPGTPASVPDPATIALVGLGLLGLGFSRRKRAS